MEVKIEQTIKLKFGDNYIELSKEDAEKLYDNLADALGYEEGTKIVYVPYNTAPYIPPQRITPYWEHWYSEPYVITSGYSQIAGEGLNTGSVTITTDKTGILG